MEKICPHLLWLIFPRTFTVYTQVMNEPEVLSTKKCFSSYRAYNKQPQTFGYVSRQKYFVNNQWHKKKTLKYLYFQN